MPPTLRHTAVLAAVVLLTAVAVGLRAISPASAARPAEPAQADTVFYLPELQVPNPTPVVPTSVPPGARPAGARLAGHVGFGTSVIELQNTSDGAVDIDLTIQRNLRADVRASRRLPAGAMSASELRAIPGVVDIGRYSAVLAGDGSFGAVGRTSWPEATTMTHGSEIVYEAVPAGRNLILPLLVRDVYSHTTIFMIKNADQSASKNRVMLTFFEPDTGEIIKQIYNDFEAGQTGVWDTMFDRVLFRDLPQNTATGYTGALHVSADEPVAMVAYGDEFIGATSAYVGRRRDEADETQLLPLVRANYLGNTLIAIAHGRTSGGDPIDVTITYRGAPFSPAGANQTFEQQLQLSPRGAAFVDLGPRGLGTRPAPDLPRGGGANQGFVGSAEIRASDPILVVARDTVMEGGEAHGSSAYNAYRPQDLGRSFALTHVAGAAEGRSTQAYVFNPGTEEAAVALLFLGAGGAAQGSVGGTVAAGSLGRFDVPADRGHAAARLTSDVAVAVVAVDTSWRTPADVGRRGRDMAAYAPVRLAAGDVEPPTPPPPTETGTATATAPPTRPASATPTEVDLRTPTPTAPTRSTATATGQVRSYLPRALRGSR
jgi:hypothetical protein